MEPSGSPWIGLETGIINSQVKPIGIADLEIDLKALSAIEMPHYDDADLLVDSAVADLGYGALWVMQKFNDVSARKTSLGYYQQSINNVLNTFNSDVLANAASKAGDPPPALLQFARDKFQDQVFEACLTIKRSICFWTLESA